MKFVEIACVLSYGPDGSPTTPDYPDNLKAFRGTFEAATPTHCLFLGQLEYDAPMMHMVAMLKLTQTKGSLGTLTFQPVPAETAHWVSPFPPYIWESNHLGIMYKVTASDGFTYYMGVQQKDS